MSNKISKLKHRLAERYNRASGRRRQFLSILRQRDILGIVCIVEAVLFILFLLKVVFK